MDTMSSSPSRIKAYIKCAVYLFISVGFLMFIVPELYGLSPTLRNYMQTLDDNDIHPGAIYYTDVPLTPESELANRMAVKEGIAKRAARIK